MFLHGKKGLGKKDRKRWHYDKILVHLKNLHPKVECKGYTTNGVNGVDRCSNNLYYKSWKNQTKFGYLA